MERKSKVGFALTALLCLFFLILDWLHVLGPLQFLTPFVWMTLIAVVFLLVAEPYLR